VETGVGDDVAQRRRALAALRDDLRDRIADEIETTSALVYVAQTGDVEALGAAAPGAGDWRDAYPSWAHLENLTADCPDRWLHAFGNHDVWEGVYPLFQPRGSLKTDRIADVELLDGDWTRAYVDTSAAVPLVIAKLNTVDGTLPAELLARGRVRPFPSRKASMAEVLDELRAQFEPFRGREAIRVVLMHNPPHAFAATRWDGWTTAYLAGAEELAETLAELRVQVVIAGHRHALDPPAGAENYSFTQRPLREPTVQLVAETPTQRWTHHDSPPLSAAASRSYCRYRLVIDELGEAFSVLRTTYRHTTATGLGGFRPTAERERAVFAQVPPRLWPSSRAWRPRHAGSR
jgi:3',5'-cyclic AMP phosphodiesterase CpdA